MVSVLELRKQKKYTKAMIILRTPKGSTSHIRKNAQQTACGIALSEIWEATDETRPTCRKCRKHGMQSDLERAEIRGARLLAMVRK